MLDQPHETHVELRSRRRMLCSRRFPIWRTSFAALTVACIGIAAYPYIPRYYVAYAAVVVRPAAQSGSETKFTPTTREALDDNAIQTKMDVIRTQPLQRRVAERFSLVDDPEMNSRLATDPVHVWLNRYRQPPTNLQGEVLAKLDKMLMVRREKHTYMLQVGYESKDPDKSARLTNALVEAFVADSVARKDELNARILTSLKARIALLQKVYDLSEKIEHDFMVSSGLIHRSEIDSLARQSTTLSDALAAAHAKTVSANDRAALLTNAQRTNSLDSVTEILASPLLEHLRERLVGLSTGSGFGNSVVPTGANDTVVRSLREAIAVEMQRIVRAAQGEAQTASATEAALRGEITRIDARLTQLQEASRTLDLLDRRTTSSRNALTDAMNQYDQEAGKQFQPDMEVVAQAVPPIRATFPNPLLYAGGLFMLAILAGMLPALPWLFRVRADASYAR
jgi:uncharacterized protein involved in exopolysaccharide biosynthesis